MGARIIYNPGQVLGPYGIKYIKEIEPYINPKDKKSIRQAEFECPHCEEHRHFNARISNVKNGHTKSCGCLSIKASTETIKKWNKEHPDPWNKHYPVKNEIINDFGVKYIEESNRIEYKANNNTAKLRYIIAECPVCGCHFEALYENIKRNLTGSCGCSVSRGEEKVCNILQQFPELVFKRQKTFKDLKSQKGRPLRYDFYIPSKNLLIEYDGIQHFEYRKTNSWNNKENFLKTKERDEIKNQYAKNNNIYLLRIPYTDFNVLSKEYLEEKINEICAN